MNRNRNGRRALSAYVPAEFRASVSCPHGRLRSAVGARRPLGRTPHLAHGQEPGWIVTITGGRIDYVGDYGETKISVPRPEPRATFNGHRYDTPRLTVDITHVRCNDVMSGYGFADQVMVIADAKTLKGCGGERRKVWDI